MLYLRRIVPGIGMLLMLIPITLPAQSEESAARAITMDEYELAHTFDIEDLDNDTYVKFDDGRYILDRYEMRQPIFITGDDGRRKRVDLYKLVAREGLLELGLMIFYTTENGDLYKAVLPNYTAAGDIWERYFEDIHTTDKEEENYVLKLSYVLSRELSFQIYKGLNSGLVAEEDVTYGTDICFPGDQVLTMANGESRLLKDLKPGDQIITLNPLSKTRSVVEVKKLVVHVPENYAITELTVIRENRIESETFVEFDLDIKKLKATPNHPMLTSSGNKEMRHIQAGEEILSWNGEKQTYDTYTVFETREITEGVQPVYSIEAHTGNTLLVNGVLVRQK